MPPPLKINRHHVLPSELEINRHNVSDALKINRHSILPSELEFSKHDLLPVFEPVGELASQQWHAVGETIRSSGRELRRAGRDAERFGKKIEAEGKRAGKNTERFVKASGKYVEGTFRDYRDMYSVAIRQTLEGKLTDSYVTLAFDGYKSSDRRLAELVTSSSYANAFAASFASFAGPAGAAAYSSWYTYKVTGDTGLAIKAGLISGTLNGALGKVSGMEVRPDSPISDIASKAVLAGAASGVAVAAAGGDEDDIRSAFLRGGFTMAINDGYRQYTGRSLQADGRPPGKGGFCALTVNAGMGSPECALDEKYYLRNEDGSVKTRTLSDGSTVPLRNTALLPADHNTTGLSNAAGEAGIFSEQSPVMETIGKIPFFNAGSMAHDKMVDNLGLESLAVQASIPLVIVPVMMGSPAGVQNDVTQAAIKSKKATRPMAIKVPPYELPSEKFSFFLARLITPQPMSSQGEKVSNPVPRDPALVEAERSLSEPALSFVCFKDARLVDGATLNDSDNSVPLATRSVFVASDTTASSKACAVIVQAKQEAAEDLVAFKSPSSLDGCRLAAYALANQFVDNGWECLIRGDEAHTDFSKTTSVPSSKNGSGIANLLKSLPFSKPLIYIRSTKK